MVGLLINGRAVVFSRKTGAGKCAAVTAWQVEICKKQLVWGSRHDFCKRTHCSWPIVGVLTSLFSVYENLGATEALARPLGARQKASNSISYLPLCSRNSQTPRRSRTQKETTVGSPGTLFRGEAPDSQGWTWNQP